MKRLVVFGFILALLPISSFRRAPAPPPSAPPSRGELRRHGEYEDLAARRLHEIRRLADPETGALPPGIHRKEQEFAARLPKATGDKGLSWSSRGPWNIGGRTRAIDVDVSDPTNFSLLAGGVSGGLWRSEDQGATWTLTTGSSKIHNVSCLVQDTRVGNRRVWYYGTGEGEGYSTKYPQSTFLAGDGVFKSVDGGHSWTVLPATTGNDPENPASPWQYIWNLALDSSPDGQGALYAATWGGIQRSVNGGNTWTHVLGAGGVPASYTDVAVTPSGVVYATLSYDGTVHGFFRSTDGINWTDLTPPGVVDYDRLVLAVAPSNENVVWIVSANTIGEADAGLFRYQYLSGDGSLGAGGQFEDRSGLLGSLPGPFGYTHYETQESYCQMLAVHPADSETVFLGGVFLWRSTDGFQTPGNISFIGGWEYPQHHADLHRLVFLPGSSAAALTGSDGGVHLTPDVGAGTVDWLPLNDGYNTSQFYKVAIDENLEGSEITLGGTQDSGTWLGTLDSPTADWFDLLGGDGGFCAVASAEDPAGTYYMSYQQAYGIYRAVVDHATGTPWTWDRIDPQGAVNSQWLWPFILDPNDTDLMYLAGDTVLWRNSGLAGIPAGGLNPTPVNWEAMHTLPGDSPITALAMSRSATRILYFGTADGEFYRLEAAHAVPAGTAPTRLDLGAGFPPGAYVSGIAVNPNDDQEVLVAFSNYNVANLYHSTTGGAIWTNVEGNLAGPGSPSVRTVAILPSRDGAPVYLAGTSTGLYSTATLAGAATVWTQEAPTLIGNVVVDHLAVRPSDNLVVVGSHGRGVFRGYPKPSAVGDDLPGLHALAQNVPNPFNPTTKITFTLAGPGPVRLEVFDLAGHRVRVLAAGPRRGGPHTIRWDGTDDAGRALGSGTYIYRLHTREGELSRKATLVR